MHLFATGGPPANDTPEFRVGGMEELYSGYSGSSESASMVPRVLRKAKMKADVTMSRQVTVTGRDYRRQRTRAQILRN